jgi:hypothetical protein
MAKSQLWMFEAEQLWSILGKTGLIPKNEEPKGEKTSEAVLCSVLREVSGGNRSSSRPADSKRLK